MKKMKSLFIGAGIATMSVVPAAAQLIKLEGCSGSCGACGFACVSSVAGLAVMGLGTVGVKKIREKRAGPHAER